MSKVKFADRIEVENCECCGSVHVQMWSKDRLFAVAIPSTVEEAEDFAAGLEKATDVMRAWEGKPHGH